MTAKWLVAVSVVVVTAGAAFMNAQDERVAARAKRLHREAIVIDTHIDTTERLRPGWKFEERHLAPSSGAADASSVDLPRMREGGLDAAFFSVFIPGTITGPKAVNLAKAEFDKLKVLIAGHPQDLVLCTTADEVRAAHRENKVAVLIGVEGGHMINNDLGVLRDYAGMGARYLTLTHTVNVGWADSSSEKPTANGLTDFGRSVVRELNRLGMMVDVSHVSDKTFWDVLEVSQAPVIASHSACRALCGHARNLTDDMIKALAAKGGVIQINFMDGYIDQALYEAQEKLRPQMEKVQAELAQKYPGPENEDKRWQEARAAYKQMMPTTTVSWERILDHIDHAVKLVGPDHVGLGSDFDGASMPQGMEDCSQLPKITEGLITRGYKDPAIKKILGENTLRVMAQVEKVARNLAKQGGQ
jgi:membrane dipeptidase